MEGKRLALKELLMKVLGNGTQYILGQILEKELEKGYLHAF